MKDAVTPKIVCLCGIAKSWRELRQLNLRETMTGNICLTTAICINSGLLSLDALDDNQKKKLDELRKRKIDLADEVFIVNAEGYIGDSTISEIKYALKTRKPIRWLEPTVTVDALETWDVDVYIESLISSEASTDKAYLV